MTDADKLAKTDEIRSKVCALVKQHNLMLKKLRKHAPNSDLRSSEKSLLAGIDLLKAVFVDDRHIMDILELADR